MVLIDAFEVMSGVVFVVSTLRNHRFGKVELVESLIHCPTAFPDIVLQQVSRAKKRTPPTFRSDFAQP